MSLIEDYEIRFTEETGSSNRRWGFQEFKNGLGGKGKQVGRDYRPFDGNVSFTATDLVYREFLSHSDGSGPYYLSWPRPLGSDDFFPETSESIAGMLRSGTMKPGGFKPDGVTYSFFGVSAPVSGISLRILKRKEGERCRLIGYPSEYTDEPEEDPREGALEIALEVTPERFDHLASRVRAGDIGWLNIFFLRVDGFYTEFSSTMAAYKIKLMPYGGGKLNIEGIEKEKLSEIPTLRGAGQVSLEFGRKADLLIETSLVEGSTKDPDQPHSANQLTAMILAELKKNTESIGSIRVVLMLTAFLVFVTMFTVGNL